MYINPQFIVFRHNHSGWIKSIHESETAADALRAAIYQACPWLSGYPHELKLLDDRYVVNYAGEPRGVALGRTQYAGFWFGDPIRIGIEDDCEGCGGTGQNHYNPFRECWKCGDSKTRGTSCGKKLAEGSTKS